MRTAHAGMLVGCCWYTARARPLDRGRSAVLHSCGARRRVSCGSSRHACTAGAYPIHMSHHLGMCGRLHDAVHCVQLYMSTSVPAL